MPPRRKGFFAQETRPEDDLARTREVEALIAPRRTVVQDLPISRLRPNPFQARRRFDGLEELAQTIQTQGFTTRLRVRPDPNDGSMFQLVYGERRLRAAALAGLEHVPCEIAEHSDDELIEIGLAENIQRHDLDPLDEAQAFRALLDQRGYSIRRLAERIGKDKSYIEDRLVLLRAPEDVRQMVAERPDTLRAARELTRLPTPEERRPIIEAVAAGQLSTTELRRQLRTAADHTERPPQSDSVSEIAESAWAIDVWDAQNPRWPLVLELVARLEQSEWLAASFDWHQGSVVLVAHRMDAVLGFLRFVVQPIGPEADHAPLVFNGQILTEAKILAFGVAPAHRRQGIGRALQEHAIQHAQQLGCYQVRSFSSGDHAANHHLKLSMGFSAHPVVHDAGMQEFFFLMPLGLEHRKRKRINVH